MDFAIIDILFGAPYQGDQLGLGYTHTSTPSEFEFNFSVFDMWRNPYFTFSMEIPFRAGHPILYTADTCLYELTIANSILIRFKFPRPVNFELQFNHENLSITAKKSQHNTIWKVIIDSRYHGILLLNDDDFNQHVDESAEKQFVDALQ